MLTQAQKKGGTLLVQARLEALPFRAASFSRILLVDALHHVRDQEAGLDELARVLEGRGRVVVIEPDIRRFAVTLVRLAEALLGMGSRFRSAAEIMAMLARRGLRPCIAGYDAFRVWIVADGPSGDDNGTS